MRSIHTACGCFLVLCLLSTGCSTVCQGLRGGPSCASCNDCVDEVYECADSCGDSCRRKSIAFQKWRDCGCAWPKFCMCTGPECDSCDGCPTCGCDEPVCCCEEPVCGCEDICECGDCCEKKKGCCLSDLFAKFGKKKSCGETCCEEPVCGREDVCECGDCCEEKKSCCLSDLFSGFGKSKSSCGDACCDECCDDGSCGGCDPELYWSEWHNDPPRCKDPCDRCGNWVGPGGPYRAPYSHAYMP